MRTLAFILSDYQKSLSHWGPDVQRSLEGLKQGKACVVTGQQVGLATGPLYTVFKAISCVKLARERGLVPLFWAATEDHDVEEVASARRLSVGGDLRRYRVQLPKGKFVEDIAWKPEYHEQLDALLVPKEAQLAATAGAERYAEVMVRLLAYLMRGTGLLFIEPFLLRPLARQFFVRELEEAVQLHSVLHAQSMRTQDALLKFPEGSTNLFYKSTTGHRLRIRYAGDRFQIGDENRESRSLIDEVDHHPERFSTGVAARPVLQNALIPTAAYVAGPNEQRYLQQLTDYHAVHGAPFPRVVPRLSATLLPPSALAKDASPKQLHYLRNLLRPLNRPQERVLNWWMFEDGSLVQQLLDQTRGDVVVKIDPPFTQSDPILVPLQ